MRHLLLAAPLLALATACTEPCSAPALTVSWTFTGAAGATGLRCHDAGVETVDLWIDGVQVAAGTACAQGSATFTGLAAGDHAFTARGNRAGGTTRYQTWGTLSVASCGETRALVQPGAGTLRVDYSTTTGLCYALADATQTEGFVWYQLLDRNTGLVTSSVNGAQAPAALPCQTGDNGWFDLEVPWGLYRLRWIQVVTDPTGTTPVPIYQYCPDLTPAPVPTIDVDVVQTGRTTLDIPMAPYSGACIP